MALFLSIVRSLFRGPWLYVYTLASAVGIIASYLNSGLRGSPYYGGAAIISTIVGLVVYYRHLNHCRNKMGFPHPMEPGALFFHSVGFYVRVLLVLLPFAVALGLSPYLDHLTQSHLSLTIAAPDARLRELPRVLALIWPWVALYFTMIVLNDAGASYVVARGSAQRGLRALPSTLAELRLPLALFFSAYLFMTALNSVEYFYDFEAAGLPGGGTVIFMLLIVPKYVLQVGGTLYMATRLIDGSRLSPPGQKESAP